MSSASEDQPKINDDEVYTEGDATIISADNWRFRVPSYFLLAASGMIRDMHPPGSTTPLEIKMVDPALESSAAIRLWLDVATGRGLPPIHKFLGAEASAIMYLARKYDCKQIADSTISVLFNALDEKVASAYMILRVGLLFDQPGLVAKALRSRPKATFSKPESVTLLDLDSLHSESIYDPAAWPLDAWRDFPVDQVWAMSRTMKLGGTDTERAERYLSLSKQIKEKDQGSKKRKLDHLDQTPP